MAKDLMRYDLMAQEALRGVVRQALLKAAMPQGLPGPHHFYITFRTRAPGVDIDPSLLEKYPDEMTIVLEHQFWDLEVTDTGFEVTLKFGGVPKYIKMPYSAVSRFHDPSVGFHLQFEPSLTGGDGAAEGGSPAKTGARPAPADGEAGQVVSLDSFRKK
ncbi:SspB family protein [Maricaulis sp.]|uniref:SspB family protein n=1 Tax=Maricaulis sp. TaxID=1486257 RepID=UPI003A9288D5